MTTQDWDPDVFDAFEAEGWEERAADYAAMLVDVTAYAVEDLLDAARVGPGTRVLDVAAGPGHVSKACANRGAQPVGLDVAHEMVAVARARYPDLDFRQGDAHHLPFADRSLDSIVGNFAILHLGRPERAVAEFVRVLAPGGSLALSTWDTPDRTRMIGVFLDAAQEADAKPLPHVPAGPPFFRFADDTEFSTLLSDAGLAKVTVWRFAYQHRFADADALWEAIRRGTVRTRGLVFDQQSDVLARIRQAYERLLPDYTGDDGRVEMPISVKIAAGTRAAD
jgi:trans-aconitate methyltransferase